MYNNIKTCIFSVVSAEWLLNAWMPLDSKYIHNKLGTIGDDDEWQMMTITSLVTRVDNIFQFSHAL